jgi:predicted signal transduction protein with EAL and GGDEF domain
VLRTGDLLGRLGGDEFAVVAVLDAGAVPDEASAALGDRLLARLGEPFRIGGMAVHVASSIGLTSRGALAAPADGRTGAAELLLQQADAAMYAAKRAGTGVTVFDRTRHGDVSGHLALVEELRTGLRTGQLVLFHQPQVDVRSGVPLGVEALVRWAHPQRGLLGPAEFLPLAEVHGLMGLITDEVLRQAVTQAAAWWHGGRRLRMSVNLSASNLLDTDLPARVSALLEDTGLPPEGLVLEVTESVLISDPDRSLAVVARLADLGVTVSIDDFGTGYSSLSYLRELPVAELKLDRSFTAGLLTDARTEAIVASTITLATGSGCASSPRASSTATPWPTWRCWAATTARGTCTRHRCRPTGWSVGSTAPTRRWPSTESTAAASAVTPGSRSDVLGRAGRTGRPPADTRPRLPRPAGRLPTVGPCARTDSPRSGTRPTAPPGGSSDCT